MINRKNDVYPDCRERLKEASLILTGPYDGRPYNRSDFLEGIADALGTTEAVSAYVLALGPLSRNQEWYITMTSVENKDLRLDLGTLNVKDKQFRIKSADNRKFTARHLSTYGAPPWTVCSCCHAPLHVATRRGLIAGHSSP